MSRPTVLTLPISSSENFLTSILYNIDDLKLNFVFAIVTVSGAGAENGAERARKSGEPERGLKKIR